MIIFNEINSVCKFHLKKITPEYKIDSSEKKNIKLPDLKTLKSNNN